MGTLVGFVVGYVVGASRSSDGQAKLRNAVDTMLDSPQFRSLVERGAELAERLTARTAGREDENGVGLGDQVKALLEGNGQLREALRTIADSDLVKSVVASGLSFAGDLFDRGKTLLENAVDEGRGRSEAIRPDEVRMPRGTRPAAGPSLARMEETAIAEPPG